MELIDRIDEARSRWNVLDHPFYRRWEQGGLSREELGSYAGQYRHAVAALARTAERAAPLAGPAHAEEEAAHVALWDDFGARFGSSGEQPANPETAACSAAWSSASDPLEALAILYAVEAGQPEISRTKLAGLVEHYGVAADARAASYFVLHGERDHEHAAESRALLEQHAKVEDEDRLVAAAERALRGNWALLDGVSA
jgi:pyrroloquinoline-quinone synthase